MSPTEEIKDFALAMGNSGDRTFVPALARALANPGGLVRSHAAGALGKLGGRQTRQLLESAKIREGAKAVLAEIAAPES